MGPTLGSRIQPLDIVIPGLRIDYEVGAAKNSSSIEKYYACGFASINWGTFHTLLEN
jgi:hypothetical protein